MPDTPLLKLLEVSHIHIVCSQQDDAMSMNEWCIGLRAPNTVLPWVSKLNLRTATTLQVPLVIEIPLDNLFLDDIFRNVVVRNGDASDLSYNVGAHGIAQ